MSFKLWKTGKAFNLMLCKANQAENKETDKL